MSRFRGRIQDAQEILDLLDAIEAGSVPDAEDLEGAPTIDFWGRDADRPLSMAGLVRGHPTIPDGSVSTSAVIAIDEKAGWMRTIGRWYKLGRSAADHINEAIRSDGGLQ